MHEPGKSVAFRFNGMAYLLICVRVSDVECPHHSLNFFDVALSRTDIHIHEIHTLHTCHMHDCPTRETPRAAQQGEDVCLQSGGVGLLGDDSICAAIVAWMDLLRA